MIWPAVVVLGISILGDVLNIATKADDGPRMQIARMCSVAFAVFAVWCLL